MHKKIFSKVLKIEKNTYKPEDLPGRVSAT